MTMQFSRTARILGENTIKKLSSRHIAIFGLGGVGGYAAEALVRSGIGKFDLIDHDKIDITNLNRQIIATHKTIGRDKAEVMRERMLEINPEAEITIHPCFFLPDNADSFDFTKYDYIIDAVDTVTAKIELVLRAQAAGVPIISSMGTGNKLNPAMLEAADIYETSVCPLARVMRRELKKRGVKKLKVVYSKEEPLRAEALMEKPLKTEALTAKPLTAKPLTAAGEGGGQGGFVTADEEINSFRAKCEGKEASQPENLEKGILSVKRAIPGSTAFVPPAAGLLIASEVVRDLIQGSCLSL